MLSDTAESQTILIQVSLKSDTLLWHSLTEAANNFHLEFKVTQDTCSLELCDFAGGFSVMPQDTQTGFFWLYTQSHIFSVWPD